MLVYLAALETEQEKTKFEQLYLTYRQTMFYVANSILQDPQLAEDAVHQAFLRIMDHMGNILEIECPQTKSFVVIIVKNIAINCYNRRKKQTVLSFDELADWSVERTAAPANEIESREGYGCLMGLIGQMPESYRSVLLLKYDNGYSTAEIASMLDLTEENVKKRIQRARKKLEQILDTKGVNT